MPQIALITSSASLHIESAMILHAWKASRLRPVIGVRMYSDILVYRRLADKSHRSLYASLEKEASRRRTNKNVLELRPTISHFLVWLHQKQKGELAAVTLPEDGLPTFYREFNVLETLLFHILTCLHSAPEDVTWLHKQQEHLSFLQGLFSGAFPESKKLKYWTGKPSFVVTRKDLESFVSNFRSVADDLGSNNPEFSVIQMSILSQAMQCIALACPSVLGAQNLLPWLRSLSAPTILRACAELSELSDIPAFVTSDILHRTPMEPNEFHLQLELWNIFKGDIAITYHSKTLASPIPSILQNLAVQAINWNCSSLPQLVENAIAYFTSTLSGYKFNIFHVNFCNDFIFLVAFASIKNGLSNRSIAPIIKTQATLVKYLTNKKLSQKGYIGIVLAISHESTEKANKLFETALAHFPSYTSHCAITKIYLSSTVEELMHHFNHEINRFPQCSNAWLVLIKKLIFFELLTEKRSQKLLVDLLNYSGRLVISKEIILDLLLLVNTIHGIELFIKTLSRAQLFLPFRNTILTKYMLLLYKYSDQPSIFKPFLNQLCPGETNLNSARTLYRQIQWKSSTTVGIMLNGEVNHQPEKIYELYLQESKFAAPNEAILNALLRASLKRPSGKPLIWGDLFASQIAVHEFKLNVAESMASLKSVPGLIVPSDKLWRSYIKCLIQADYIPELAEIIRWWEELQFQPKKSTLVLLLQGLPREFVERHIKHAHATGKTNGFLLAWPWPGSEEI